MHRKLWWDTLMIFLNKKFIFNVYYYSLLISFIFYELINICLKYISVLLAWALNYKERVG